MPALLNFLLRQVKRKDIYLLFAATLTMTLMYAWKGEIRNSLFWDVNNK